MEMGIKSDDAIFFLLNSAEIAKGLNFQCADPADLNEIVDFYSKLSRDELQVVLPVVAEVLLEVKPELVSLLEEVKRRKETRGISPDPDGIEAVLQVISRNWQAVALLTVAIRILGKNAIKAKSFEYKGDSIVKDLLSFFKQK